jgi:hypothetical protein
MLLLLLLLLPACTPPGGFGYKQLNSTAGQAPQSSQQPAVEAMSLYINPPNTPTPGNPAIDALYEADHPAFESRMQGGCCCWALDLQQSCCFYRAVVAWC